MSFNFSRPSFPRHSTRGSRRSRHSSPDARLSVIAEDGPVPPVPPVPQRAYNRPFSRIWHGDPPRHSYENSPPRYSVWDATGPKGEKLVDVRNNKYIARRGGWRRFFIIAIVAIAILIALIVGLVVGLHEKHSSKSNQPSSPSSNSSTTPNATFPVGSYAVTTFLDTVSTNCTSNPATWRCYPYTTYSSSPSDAMSTFNWIITASASGSATNYSISSTNNPFAPNFVNVSLNLVDANSATERYTFQTTVNKAVEPSTAITTDNSMATCFFNDTLMEANLYTNISKSYPTGAESNSTSGFQPWPYAVTVTQTIGGGSDVPDCYEVVNGDLGARITNGFTSEPSGNICSCSYKNYDP